MVNATLQALPNQGMYITDCNTNSLPLGQPLSWGQLYCDGRGQSTLIGRIKKTALGMQRRVYAYVRTCTEIALDIVEIPTWVIRSPSPVAAAPPNPLEV